MSFATGTFEVERKPQPADHADIGNAIGRFLLDKRYKGALEAISKGVMIAAGTSVQGSAGYVAIEIVTGSLDGKGGSFALQHNGIMNRGTGDLSVVVIPDSGTGDLSGISGKMSIVVKDGAHAYDFTYEIESPK